MANGNKVSGRVEIWTVELALWQKRVEKLWKVKTRLSVTATGRGSEVSVYVEVFTLVDGKPFTRMVRAGFDYPNANVASFDTQVLGLLAQAEARTEEAVEVFKAQRNML